MIASTATSQIGGDRPAVVVIGDRQGPGVRCLQPRLPRHRARRRHLLARAVHVVVHRGDRHRPGAYVCPVAIFSSRFALNVKLSASAAATAETGTGTGSLAAGLRTAVTVLTPSFS